jgi:hypothetical protein
LEWNISVPYVNKTYRKQDSIIDGFGGTKEYQVESMVTLILDRTSEPGNLPIVSQLSINNVSVNLNETMVYCTERDQDNNNIIIQTVIHIINSDFGK